MARHFTKANVANGYAAMGNSLRRPRIKGAGGSKGDIKAAIEAERAKANRMQRAAAAKKK